LDSQPVKKFKKKAMEIYSYKKRAVKKGMENTLGEHAKEEKADWDQLVGVLDYIKEDSVELQHKLWKKAR
jgi:hypothetical protein